MERREFLKMIGLLTVMPAGKTIHTPARDIRKEASRDGVEANDDTVIVEGFAKCAESGPGLADVKIQIEKSKFFNNSYFSKFRYKPVKIYVVPGDADTNG